MSELSKPIIFINVGWMHFYKGILADDSIYGGGKYIKANGWGGEIYNFKEWKSMVYGYGQPKIDRKHGNAPQIKIEKLGADDEKDLIKGVTVVWTAKKPKDGGTYIVGWYINATVYRFCQSPPLNSNRRYGRRKIGYFISAKASNSKLLPFEERTIRIKRQAKGWMGQSNIWYAKEQPKFVSLVNDYIFRGILPVKYSKELKLSRIPRQNDPLKRIEIEKKAIIEVMKYYNNLGYVVKSVEKDNLGWDLTATKNKIELKLEVKGLSGVDFYAELTPNEYRQLKESRLDFRICIVTNTLNKPKLTIFYYSNETGIWNSDKGDKITFDEVISARIRPKE